MQSPRELLIKMLKGESADDLFKCFYTKFPTYLLNVVVVVVVVLFGQYDSIELWHIYLFS